MSTRRAPAHSASFLFLVKRRVCWGLCSSHAAVGGSPARPVSGAGVITRGLPDWLHSLQLQHEGHGGSAALTVANSGSSSCPAMQAVGLSCCMMHTKLQTEAVRCQSICCEQPCSQQTRTFTQHQQRQRPVQQAGAHLVGRAQPRRGCARHSVAQHVDPLPSRVRPRWLLVVPQHPSCHCMSPASPAAAQTETWTWGSEHVWLATTIAFGSVSLAGSQVSWSCARSQACTLQVPESEPESLQLPHAQVW